MKQTFVESLISILFKKHPLLLLKAFHFSVPCGHHVYLNCDINGMSIVRAYTPTFENFDLDMSIRLSSEKTSTRQALHLIIKIYDDGAMTPYLRSLTKGKRLIFFHFLSKLFVHIRQMENVTTKKSTVSTTKLHIHSFSKGSSCQFLHFCKLASDRNDFSNQMLSILQKIDNIFTILRVK